MTQQTIIINQQTITLDATQVIQSGGEGMVFGLGETAVKLYHQPRPAHAAKLRHLLNSGLSQRLPPGVLGPSALATDQRGLVIGFQMARLPVGSAPIKKLSNLHFRHQQGITTADVLALFQRIHATLSALHRLGVIVGDLNDQNIFLTPGARLSGLPAWLDVDSYQISPFPCPVAMELFLDPQLYGVADFGQRPYFSQATDWYAFFVLLVRSLLGVHPYGGVHPQHKTLAARAQAGVSILHPAVVYPAAAVPPASLSPALRQHVRDVFERGQRGSFPVALLNGYTNNQIDVLPVLTAVPDQTTATAACLLTTPGSIEAVRVMDNGRLRAVVHDGEQFRLVELGIGGILRETALFNGRAGCRFALFGDGLAVNPPDSQQLLLLDIGGGQPRKMQMLATELFGETAVFAATPRHLYRIAGNWIMRGAMQRGLYVEEAIATAHRRQTQFWASPYGPTLAGYHRVFAEQRCFVWHDTAVYDVALPALAAGESVRETAVTFGPSSIAFWRKGSRRGTLFTDLTLLNHHGRVEQHISGVEEMYQPGLYPFMGLGASGGRPLPSTLAATSITQLHDHPAGVIAQTARQLFLI
ncbi:MAG: hypothetical protein IPM39_21580 [Chloroflexi bacterium]|nr:hypothetical protein [Chloroflexota bacterium]